MTPPLAATAGPALGSGSRPAPDLPESYVLIKGLDLHPSQDYALLRKEGIEHIQRLGHRLWTDHNVHDPGITLLELACYGITDLGYRAGYDMADLLTGESGGKPVTRADFHRALSVLTCDPVTFQDLRKRLVDVNGVRNAWVERNRDTVHSIDEANGVLVQDGAPSNPPNPPLNGLYDVLIEYEDWLDGTQRAHIGPDERRTALEYIKADGRYVRIDAERPARIVAVSVIAERPGTVRVRLTKRGFPTREKTVDVTASGRKTRIELNFDVPAGTHYRLDCEGSRVKLHRDKRAYGGGGSAEAASPIKIRGSYQKGDQDPKALHYFLFDVEVEFTVEAAEQEHIALTKQDVRRAVYERLQSDRNLGEDLVAIKEAEREDIALCADIEVHPKADVERVVAGIYARLREHVAPTVNFYTIGEMQAKGKPTEEIFEGPILDHGFIDDDEFEAMTRLCEIRVSDVIRIIMEDEDVQSVKKASLLSYIDNRLQTRDDWLLPLATDRFRSPAFSPVLSKLVLYKDGLPYYPGRKRVQDLMAIERQLTLREELQGDDRDLAVPLGRPRSVETYSPLQNELPATYFAGRRKVPVVFGEQRDAQSKQLKAYLMFFEQLLANFLSQLAHVPQLLSYDDGEGLRSYFTQPVEGGWANQLFSAPVRGQLRSKLEQLVEDPQTAGQRRDRFLDHLIARFAEDFTEYSLLMYGRSLAADRATVIDDKRRFLRHYPAMSGQRGTGIDYRAPELDGTDNRDNLAGLQRRVYGLLGFDDITRRRLAEPDITIEEAADGSFGFVAVGPSRPGGVADVIYESSRLDSRVAVEALIDLTLTVGADPANYHKVGDVFEVRRGGEHGDLLGRTTAGTSRSTVVKYFERRGGAEGFHVVEHILLRPRRDDDTLMAVQLADADPDVPKRIEARDPYSFRVSVVLPSWPRRFQNLNFRRLVERTLRAEAPAHVLLKICWVSHEQMRQFEAAYEDWGVELAKLADRSGNASEPAAASTDYRKSLTKLIELLQGLINVYPVARLHDPLALSGDEPAVTLNHTSLGTF